MAWPLVVSASVVALQNVLHCVLILFGRVPTLVHLGWLIPSEMVTGPTCNYSLSLKIEMQVATRAAVIGEAFPNPLGVDLSRHA
jgi:hypothetical protein